MPDRSAEIRAFSRLAFSVLAGFTAGIGAIQRAIAQRAFDAAGPAAEPARVTHDAIAGRTNQIALLNHPEVYERLRDWLRHD